MKKRLWALSTIGSALLMTACGGGGDKTKPVENRDVTIKGVAVDELILNGKVKITKPDGISLVEGRTSAIDGTYALSIGKYKGPVVVNVSCDAETKLLVGMTQQNCPAGLKLSSVANAEANDVTVNISPVTHITYRKALQAGITKENIEISSNQVALMFGVDPIKNNPTIGTYAKIVEAFHAAERADSSKSLLDVIDAFSEDISDGVVDNSQALIDALSEYDVTTPIQNGTYVIPSNPTSLEVKKFVQDLRTQGTTIQSYVKNEAKNMGQSLDKMTIDIQTANDYVVGITNLIVKANDESKTALRGDIDVHLDTVNITVPVDVTKIGTNTWSYRTELSSKLIYTGTVSVPHITDGLEFSFENLDANFQGELPYYKKTQTEPTTQTVSLAMSFKKSNNIVNVTMNNVKIENGKDKIVIDTLKGEVSYRQSSNTTKNNLVFDYVKLSEMRLSAISGDYTVSGALTIPEYIKNNLLAERGGIQDISNVSGSMTFGCPYGTSLIQKNASLNLPNGRAYPFNITYSDSVTIDVAIEGDYGNEEIRNAITASGKCSNGVKATIYNYVYVDKSNKIGNSGYIPKVLRFEGKVKNNKTSGELSGKVNVDLTGIAGLDVEDIINKDKINMNALENASFKVSINGELIMPKRPKTLVNMGYEMKASNSKRHNIVASYAHDSTLLSLDASVDDKIENGHLVFTNGSGIKVSFLLHDGVLIDGNSHNASGSIMTKNGKVVATIEKRKGNVFIIKYLDGSFETIF